MKVILLRDVAKLGKRYSVVEVPDGFALNQLIPKGMAGVASAQNLKRVAARADKQTEVRATVEGEFTAALAALLVSPVTLAVDANAQGHLFKGVKASDIAAAVASAGHAVPVETIVLAEPIKDLGDHQITLTHGLITGVMTLTLISK